MDSKEKEIKEQDVEKLSGRCKHSMLGTGDTYTDIRQAFDLLHNELVHIADGVYKFSVTDSKIERWEAIIGRDPSFELREQIYYGPTKKRLHGKITIGFDLTQTENFFEFFGFMPAKLGSLTVDS